MKSVETAVANVLDLMNDQQFSADEFVQQLRAALAEKARDVRRNADDYTPEEYDYWGEQAYDSGRWQVLRELLSSANAELGAAQVQMVSTDDAIICEHVRTALAMLKIIERSLRQTSGVAA